jgi:hypothetical protein
MLSKTFIHGSVDFLPHMADKALPALAAGGRKFLEPFLSQALTELCLAPPLLPIALLSLA